MTVPLAPGGLPLLGHAGKLMRQPLRFLTSMREQGSVVRFRLGPRDAYLVTTPETTHEVLVTQLAAFSKGGPLAGEAKSLLGEALATSNGEFHRRQRRLAQPAFHHSRIAGYTATMSEIATAQVSAWSGEVALTQEMHRLSATILARTLFTTPEHDASTVLCETLPTLIAGLGRRAYLPLRWLHELPLPINRRFTVAARRLHTLIDEIIADYRATPGDRGDLLSMMMSATDETGADMTDQQLHDEAITMMFAGSETSAAMLVWFFHVLAAEPDVEKRVHAEVDEVLEGRAPGFDDLPKLEYTRRVINETLRAYPTGWLLTRHTTADVVLDGHPIPAGSDVFYSPYVLHHDPRSFAAPDVFDPDRWLPERLAEMPRHAFVPFSSGFRKCIGESFSLAEMAVTAAAVASRWKLRPVGTPRTVAYTTYRLDDAVMRAEPR